MLDPVGTLRQRMDWMCGNGLRACATLPEKPGYGGPIPASRAACELMSAFSTAAP